MRLRLAKTFLLRLNPARHLRLLRRKRQPKDIRLRDQTAALIQHYAAMIEVHAADETGEAQCKGETPMRRLIQLLDNVISLLVCIMMLAGLVRWIILCEVYACDPSEQ